MKTLHRALMGLALTVAVVVGFGAVQGVSPVAIAQDGLHAALGHGQAGHGRHPQHHATEDAAAHFARVAERLALSSEQQAALEAPFARTFAAMQELHAGHAAIAAELSDEQKARFGRMVHDSLATLHDTHPCHDTDHARHREQDRHAGARH